MEKIEWYQSTTLRALLVAFVSQVIVWSGIAEQLPEGAAVLAVDALLQVIAIAATAYAAWARAARANPPVTETAVRKIEERKVEEQAATHNPPSSQAGFVKVSFATVLLAIGMIGMMPSVAVLLSGCESIGVQQPKTFNERLAYALAQNTALREAATLSLQSGQLSADDAEYVLELTDRSRTLIDTAQLAYDGGDLTTAEGRLQLVLGVLTQVQTYLNSKGAK